MKYLKIFNKENIFVLVLTFYIFFWDMFLNLGIKFDIRSIIFILSFFLIKEIFNDFKKKNYTFSILKKKPILTYFQICLLLGFTITLLPMIPNGNFFNNWLSMIMFFPISFYIFSLKKIKK